MNLTIGDKPGYREHVVVKTYDDVFGKNFRLFLKDLALHVEYSKNLQITYSQ